MWIYTVPYLVTIDVIFYQVKLLVFYNVQTTNLTFVGKIWEIQYIDIALHNSKYSVTLNTMVSVVLSGQVVV